MALAGSFIACAGAAWQPPIAVSRAAAPPRAAVVSELQVLMTRLLPTLPCIDPQADAQQLACIDRGELASPVWLLPTVAEPERGFVALSNCGAPLQWDGGVQPLQLGMLSQCFSGTLHVAELGVASALEQLIGEPASLALSLGKSDSDGEPQLLIATTRGSIVWLGDKARADPGLGLGLGGERAKKFARPALTLLAECGDVRGMCVSQGAKRLYLSLGDGTLAVADLDLLDQGTCSPLRPLGPSAVGCGALACDGVSNLYLCTAEGVQVFDDEGESFLQVSTPQPATGCCFGGPGLSRLFITAGDALWGVESNVQGASPPSEALLKQMEKLGCGDDFRHVGW